MSTKSSKTNSKTASILTVVIFLIITIIYLVNPKFASKFFGVSNNKSTITSGFNIKNIQQGIPQAPKNTNCEILHHKYYEFAYSPKLRDSYWVSYILTKKMVKINRVKRKDEEFTKDPLLKNNYALSKDYYGTGYDRGHMCPAGDMNFNKTAMSECFYMTNITPQKPGLNRKIWKELEEQVRNWAVQNDSLYIVVGAIYGKKPKRIGKDKVAVPKKLYKIVADISKKDGYKAIAFIMDNKNYPDNADFMKYAITIDSLENITGIDFFAKLKNPAVEKIEANINKNLWENN
jgi:endonuclease G